MAKIIGDYLIIRNSFDKKTVSKSSFCGEGNIEVLTIPSNFVFVAFMPPRPKN